MNQTRTKIAKILSFVTVVVTTLVNSLTDKDGVQTRGTGAVISLILHILSATYLLLDFLSDLHFIQQTFIRNLNLLCILVYLVQSLIGFLQQIKALETSGLVDYDYLMLITFLLIYSLFQTIYRRRVSKIESQPI